MATGSSDEGGSASENAERHDTPRWWDVVGYRRQFVSDRMWFGFAFLAGGIGNLHDRDLFWLSCVTIPVGALLVASAVRRFWKRAARAEGDVLVGAVAVTPSRRRGWRR